MVKQTVQNKLSDDKGIMLEQKRMYDDSLLPAADEVKKLYDISPDILPWIMERTEIE